MMGGAWAISFSEAPDAERAAWRKAAERESLRYGLDADRIMEGLEGRSPITKQLGRSKWEIVIAVLAGGIFIWLGVLARRPAISANLYWAGALAVATVGDY